MTTPGFMFFNLLAAFAAFEVDLSRMRTRAGMAIAHANGKLNGSQPKLSAGQHAHLLELHDTGERSISQLAQLLCLSRATIYRALDRARAQAA
jgi:DNA invertase Pin-like site-specific DNA recombinase